MLLNTTSNPNDVFNSSANGNESFGFQDECREYLDLKRATTAEISLKLTVYTVAFLLAVVGNTFVLVIVFRKSNFKTTTNFFMANLAFCDLIMAVVCMPTSMFSIASENIARSLLKGVAGELICKMIPFLQGLSVAVSILTMFTLAGDRFFAIVFPFRKVITKQRVKALIGSLWMLGVLFSAPLLYAMKLYESGDVRVCFENWEPYFDDEKASKVYTIVLFVFLYAVPLVLVIFFYSALLRELWRGKHLHHNKTVACLKSCLQFPV